MSLTEIQRYTFYINSLQRSSGTNTNFSITTNKVMKLLSKGGRFALVMHSISIPFSFYQLDSTFNTLSVRFTSATGVLKTVTITFTQGNYTATSILTELSTQLTASAQTTSGTYVGYTPLFAFSYSNSTGFSTLIMKFGYRIDLYFSGNTTLGSFFGMTTDQILSTVNSPVSTSIVVCNPVYLLYLRSSNLVQFNNREYITSSDTISSIIYRIPVMTQSQTYIHHISNSDPFFISNDNINSINFQLTTNLNSTTSLNLQGLSFQFKLSIIEYMFPEYPALQQLSQVVTPVAQLDVNKLKDEYLASVLELRDYKRKIEDNLTKYKNQIKEPGRKTEINWVENPTKNENKNNKKIDVASPIQTKDEQVI